MTTTLEACDADRGTSHSLLVLRGMTSLLAIPAEVSHAREYVRDLLGGDHPVIDDVELCVSELVANSAVHTKSATVTVAIFGSGRMIRIEVTDCGEGDEIPRIYRGLLAEFTEGGRGLPLVAAIAGGRWGSWTDGSGRTTWCEISRADGSHPAESADDEPSGHDAG